MFDGCIWEHNLGNGAFFGRVAEQFVRVPWKNAGAVFGTFVFLKQVWKLEAGM